MSKIKNIISKNTSLFGLLLLMVIITAINPIFLSPGNLSNVLRQVSINGIIALGMTFVIISGGIDLSVGGIFGLTGGVLAAMLIGGFDPILGFLITILLGALLGAFNGILISKGKLQAFIATLGTMTLYRGITRVFMDGRPITNFKSDFIDFIGQGSVPLLPGKLLNVPMPTIILIVAIAGTWFLSRKTVFGKEFYAVGGNESTARFSGINVDRVKIKVYALSGFLTTVSSVILLSRLNSSTPNSGSGYELDAIAAVVLGGTSLSGGKGRIYGTVIGMLIIGILNNGLNILDVSSFYQDVVKGVVILLAVLIDRK